MEIPSSLTMARELTKGNPTLFKDCYETHIKIAEAMRDYYDQCKEFVEQDKPVINKINELLKNK